MSSPDPTLTSWDDKLTIETPEQTSLEFSLAGVGSRCLALVLDMLIQIAGLFILFILWAILVSQVSIGEAASGGKSLWVTALIIFMAFLIEFGYFAFFEAIWNGQTIGKRAAHIRVIQESGKPLQVWQAIARNLMRIVDQIPGVYAVGMVSVLMSKQNRRLGDFVAGTVVVHERPLTGIAIGWANARTGAANAIPLGVLKLDAEEVRLIEAFLERRSFLDVDVRARMARQIAKRIAERLGYDPQQIRAAGYPSEEVFLEAVAQERAATRSR
jgi:uncharacterized RDD family membrane protein YckC